MDQQVAITAEPRSDFGKGAARRIRRSGLVPAVIYGHGQEIQHVALPDHDLALALRKPGVVLQVSLEGKTTLVAPKDVKLARKYYKQACYLGLAPDRQLEKLLK